MPDQNSPVIEGPAFSYDSAADYLNCSKRQVQVLEEQGELHFFKISAKLKKTTKGQCDALLQRAFAKRLAELEGCDSK